MTSTPQARPLPVVNGWRPMAAEDQAAAARAEAEQVLDAARRDADQIRTAAQAEAERVAEGAKAATERAQAEARQIRTEAQAAIEKKADRGKAIDVWSLRGALAATIGLTASGEYALAQLAGWTPGLAWLLPVAIDVYVVQAFRRHRDVPAALALMVLANAIFHLSDHRLFGTTADGEPTWQLIVGVAAIAPLVMWRIHRLTAPPREHAARASESSPTPRRESKPARNSQRRTRTTPPRESKSKTPAASCERKPRESSGQGSPPGEREQEVKELVALMRERGGADAVKLSEAERICASNSQATAARRLAAARDTYRKSA